MIADLLTSLTNVIYFQLLITSAYYNNITSLLYLIGQFSCYHNENNSIPLIYLIIHIYQKT